MEKLAASGDANAQFELGELYNQGESRARDVLVASSWYQKAADQDHPEAQFKLGSLYEELDKPEQAMIWLKAAAVQGHTRAQYCYGRKLNSENATRNEKNRAIHWLTLAAEKGDSDAQNNIGTLLHDKTIPEHNPALAVSWYQKATDSGNETAMNNLAYCYEHGIGVDLDEQRAKELHEKAAGLGNEQSARVLRRKGKRLSEKIGKKTISFCSEEGIVVGGEVCENHVRVVNGDLGDVLLQASGAYSSKKTTIKYRREEDQKIQTITINQKYDCSIGEHIDVLWAVGKKKGPYVIGVANLSKDGSVKKIRAPSLVTGVGAALVIMAITLCWIFSMLLLLGGSHNLPTKFVFTVSFLAFWYIQFNGFGVTYEYRMLKNKYFKMVGEVNS